MPLKQLLRDGFRREQRDVVGEYLRSAQMRGRVRRPGQPSQYGIEPMVIEEAGRILLPKKPFHRFCQEQGFAPGWVVERAIERGRSITETPEGYVL